MRLSLFGPLDRALAPAPDPAKVRWLGSVSYAHRGLHGPGVPENSLAAFSGAIAKGMGIECDVQRSADGQAVVFHDDELDRLTGETGLLRRRSAAELTRITLTGSDECIPSLRQLLDTVAGKVPLLIEIKAPAEAGGRASALCLAVRRVLEGYLGPHAIMSFDPRVPRWFARYSAHTVRGLVMSEEGDTTLLGRLRRRRLLWRAKPDFLAYDIRDLPNRFVAAQRARGLPVLTWTVNSADLSERAAHYADAPIAEGSGVL